ncbi:hypothetical protein Tco_0759594 [Tanacetum coccineum]
MQDTWASLLILYTTSDNCHRHLHLEERKLLVLVGSHHNIKHPLFHEILLYNVKKDRHRHLEERKLLVLVGEQDLRYLFFIFTASNGNNPFNKIVLVRQVSPLFNSRSGNFGSSFWDAVYHNGEDAEKLRVHTVAEAVDMNLLEKMVDGSGSG